MSLVGAEIDQQPPKQTRGAGSVVDQPEIHICLGVVFPVQLATDGELILKDNVDVRPAGKRRNGNGLPQDFQIFPGQKISERRRKFRHRRISVESVYTEILLQGNEFNVHAVVCQAFPLWNFRNKRCEQEHRGAFL